MTTIISVYYSVLGAMAIAQGVMVFMKGENYKDSREDMIFTVVRLCMTVLTTISFIVGWITSAECIALNPFAIATSLVGAAQTVLDQYEKVLALIEELKNGTPPEEGDDYNAMEGGKGKGGDDAKKEEVPVGDKGDGDGDDAS